METEKLKTPPSEASHTWKVGAHDVAYTLGRQRVNVFVSTTLETTLMTLQLATTQDPSISRAMTFDLKEARILSNDPHSDRRCTTSTSTRIQEVHSPYDYRTSKSCESSLTG